jgi:hypothetical protein
VIVSRSLKVLIGAVLVLVVLTSATTLTFAAVGSGTPAAAPAAPKKSGPLVVPDVRGQAYVFAKGMLEDAGLAWRVRGAVEGYAVNVVAAQSPAPGTILVDNGAPTVALVLSRNTSYRQVGTPENSAPYAGSPARLPGRAAKPKPAAGPKAKQAAKTKAKAKRPAKAKAKPAAKAKPKAKPVRSAARPPAFVAPGAPREPQKEMPLPDRARLLTSWLERNKVESDANLEHWRYQHAWLVYGARFGWWHGAEALRILIRVDRRTQQLWGVGAESEAQARAALDFVAQRSR